MKGFGSRSNIDFEEFELQDQRNHRDIQNYTECCLNCGENTWDVPYLYCPKLSKKARDERLAKEALVRKIVEDKIELGVKPIPKVKIVTIEKPMAGYHKREIKKGVYGQFSKIKEECEELEEALEQGVRIMSLVEASDLIGAIEAWAANNGSSLDELIKMKDVTNRAFYSGHRKPATEELARAEDEGIEHEYKEPRKECGCGGECKCGRKPTAFNPKDAIVDPTDPTSDA